MTAVAMPPAATLPDSNEHPVHRLEFTEGDHVYRLRYECEPCLGTGRVPGARVDTFKNCPHCKGAGTRARRIPGVTTVLGNLSKDALVPWAAKLAAEHVWEHFAAVDSTAQFFSVSRDALREICDTARNAHRQVKDEGAWRGSLVHDAVNLYHESYFDFQLPEQPEAERATRAFLTWAQDCGMRILESERIVCDLQERYCGTTDLVLEDARGRVLIGDVKTNNPSKDSPAGIYAEHVLQCAAYANAYEVETGRRVAGTLVLHVNKDTGEPHVFTRGRRDWRRDLRVFEALLTIHEFRKQMRPLLKAVPAFA